MMTDKLRQLAEQAAAIADQISDIQDSWSEQLSFEDWEALSENAAALRAYATIASSDDPASVLRMANALGEHCLQLVRDGLPGHLRNH